MAATYKAPDFGVYKMDYKNPHRELEPAEAEIATVGGALEVLIAQGILPHDNYDRGKFLVFRRAVAECFEIPWTTISPRMQRLIWAINAIHQPAVMIAAGAFCGNTFIANAGAGTGLGAVYAARELIGVEIKPVEADRARHNVEKIDTNRRCQIVAEDAIDTVRRHPGPIHLLYLDANDSSQRSKGIYYDILAAAWDKLPQGALLLAHNSGDDAQKLAHYLEFVRNPANCKASVNALVDSQGLEVSVRL
jgi:predicted O-methyltransferase YrrM